MVKDFKNILILLISYLLLTQVYVSAEVDTSMIVVEKYQIFDYLQTKFIGNFHRLVLYFDIDGEQLLSDRILSRENHIFSIKIADILTTDSGTTLNCAYSREDLILDQSVCSINDPITAFSPIVYIDWEYWEEYLQKKVSNSNSTLAFDITNDDSVFGYVWNVQWVDPLNNSILGTELVTKAYDKKMGSIINFSYEITTSIHEIDSAFAYEFVSVSMNYSFDNIHGSEIYAYIGILIILVILFILLNRKEKDT